MLPYWSAEKHRSVFIESSQQACPAERYLNHEWNGRNWSVIGARGPISVGNDSPKKLLPVLLHARFVLVIDCRSPFAFDFHCCSIVQDSAYVHGVVLEYEYDRGKKGSAASKRLPRSKNAVFSGGMGRAGMTPRTKTVVWALARARTSRHP